MGKGIIIGGKTYAVENEGGPILCFNWKEDGLLEFKPSQGHNKERDTDIDTAAWHWTGGEGSPEQVARTLIKRLLGVEFVIGARIGVVPYAAIYQFCDPMEVDTADTSYLNNRSIGVEMVNFAYKSGWNPMRWKWPRVAKDRKVDGQLIKGREIIEMELRERTRKVADFYPHQYGTALALSRVFNEVLGIPKLVPAEDGEVLKKTWEREKLVKWLDDNCGGNVGHYMVSDRKADPGSKFMDRLGTQDGWQLREAA